MKGLQKLQRETLQEQAYQLLKQAILSGRIALHRIYSVSEISSSLGISRTPVQTAVTRLIEEELVEMVPAQGFRIKQLSEAEARALFEFRKALEGFVVFELAGRCESLPSLEVNRDNQEPSSEATAQATVEDSTYFHRALAEKIGNKWILQSLRNAANLILLADLELGEVPERAPEAAREHASILRAVRSGEQQQAVNLMYAHLDSALKALLQRIVAANRP